MFIHILKVACSKYSQHWLKVSNVSFLIFVQCSKYYKAKHLRKKLLEIGFVIKTKNVWKISHIHKIFTLCKYSSKKRVNKIF